MDLENFEWNSNFAAFCFKSSPKGNARSIHLRIDEMTVADKVFETLPTGDNTFLAGKLDRRLTELGLKSKIIKGNVSSCEPDLQHEKDGNQDAFWLCLTKEEFLSMADSTQTIGEIHGSFRCPRWDKCILAKSPMLALTTYFYHMTELHIETQHDEVVYLTRWLVNGQQQHVRMANGECAYFARGHIFPQCQVEEGYVMKLLDKEAETQMTWKIGQKDGNSVSEAVAKSFQLDVWLRMEFQCPAMAWRNYE